MTTYQILQTITGQSLGLYDAATPAAAIRAMLADAGEPNAEPDAGLVAVEYVDPDEDARKVGGYHTIPGLAMEAELGDLDEPATRYRVVWDDGDGMLDATTEEEAVTEAKEATEAWAECDGDTTEWVDYTVYRSAEHLDGSKFYLGSEDRWLMIRPSGTEPVLRVYAQGESPEEVRKILDAARGELGI